MSLLSTDVGIAAALTGVTPGSGPARPGVRGFAAPSIDGRTDKAAVRLGALMSRGATRFEIPVYRFKGQGALGPEAWPSIGYSIVGLRDDQRRYSPTDPIDVPVLGSETSVTLSDNTKKVGYQLRRRRAAPDPVVLTVDIAAMAGDSVEAQLVFAEVLRVFPSRGGLDIVWADGSEYNVAMNRVGSQLITSDPSVESSESAGFRWVATYEIETWLDNTLDGEIVRTITQTVYSVDKL